MCMLGISAQARGMPQVTWMKHDRNQATVPWRSLQAHTFWIALPDEAAVGA